MGTIYSHISLFQTAYESLERYRVSQRHGDLTTTVILSFVAVEGFLNELAIMAKTNAEIDESVKCFGQVMTSLMDQQERLLPKYHLAYFIFTRSACPTGTEPWQSLPWLVRTRNELVHHKPSSVPYNTEKLRVEYEPNELIKEFIRRKIIPPQHPHHGRTFMSRINTLAVAEWAYNTAIAVRDAIINVIPKGSFLGVSINSIHEFNAKTSDECDSM